MSKYQRYWDFLKMKGAHSSISRLHSSVRPLSRYLGVRIATTEDERMTKKKRENETKASGVFFFLVFFLSFRRVSPFFLFCLLGACVRCSECLFNFSFLIFFLCLDPFVFGGAAGGAHRRAR